ncbi:MAG: hypothetical protein M5R36_21340 [Deltaproteobacteria bacterium]|nr:hypothetical protein [Deltaproteobacteria bacterium]
MVAEPTGKDLVKFLSDLLSGVARHSHPGAIAETNELDDATLYKRFRGLINAFRNPITISELHGDVQINDRPVSKAGDGRDIVDAFVFFMLERNLLAISFAADTTQKELVRFLDVVARSDTSSSASEEMKRAGVASIRIEPQVAISATSYDPPLEIDEGTAFFAVDETPERAEPAVAEHAEPPAGESTANLDVYVHVGGHPLDGAKVRLLGTKIPRRLPG